MGILTPDVVKKIEDGPQLFSVIEGLQLTGRNASIDKLLIPEVLEKIQTEVELINFIKTLNRAERLDLICKILTTPSIVEKFPQTQTESFRAHFPEELIKNMIQRAALENQRWNYLKSAWIFAVVQATHQRFGEGDAAPASAP